MSKEELFIKLNSENKLSICLLKSVINLFLALLSKENELTSLPKSLL